MTMENKALKEAITEALKERDATLENQLAEKFKDSNETLTKLNDAIQKSQSELESVGKVSDSVKNEIAELSKKHDEQDSRLMSIEQHAAKAAGGKGEILTLGEAFVSSEAVKSFASKQRHKGQSESVELKDITSLAASAGDGIWSFRDPEIVSDPYRPLTIRDMIPTVPVSSNLVEWVRTNVRTNNAAPVAEGATKPKSDLTYDRIETAVRKVAHYFKTSTEVLADFPRLQAEINNEGFEMLAQVEEDQLLQGDGTGQNLNGLLPQATDYDTTKTAGGDQAVDVVRRGILQVRKSFYSATGIVLNPEDWADIELLKDGENRYLFSAATTGAPRRLWGLPVMESDAMPVGEFMVGNFRQAATIYDRMNATMYMSTENEDDFINNMVSILFEERLALAVKRPLAFVHGKTDGTAFS